MMYERNECYIPEYCRELVTQFYSSKESLTFLQSFSKWITALKSEVLTILFAIMLFEEGKTLKESSLKISKFTALVLPNYSKINWSSTFLCNLFHKFQASTLSFVIYWSSAIYLIHFIPHFVEINIAQISQ